MNEAGNLPVQTMVILPVVKKKPKERFILTALIVYVVN